MSFRQDATLHCHPASPCPVVAGIAVRIAPAPGGGLSLAYRLDGSLERIRIPAAQAPERIDGLWEHTCFEAFIATAGAPGYREFNLAPSGQWAAYAFSDYRRRDDCAAFPTPPTIALRRSGRGLELAAVLAADMLPPAAGAVLQLGLAAVIEAEDGSRSYWALAHPAGRPDFHCRDAHLLNLPAPLPGH